MLCPSHSFRPRHLHGVQPGALMRRERKPAASALVSEFLYQQIEHRRALARCGIVDPGHIDDRIKRLIVNRIAPDEWVFEINEI